MESAILRAAICMYECIRITADGRNFLATTYNVAESHKSDKQKVQFQDLRVQKNCIRLA